MDELIALREAALERSCAELILDDRREAVRNAVTAALKAGARPTDVAEAAGWTPAYVRRIARSEGIPAR